MWRSKNEAREGTIDTHEPSSIVDAAEQSIQKWPDQVWIDPATGEKIVLPPQNDSYFFGNPNYPIASFRDLILDTISDNQVTILASGTGNGKSISVVQYLYESNKYRYIYQTQPRVVATRENQRFTLRQMSEAAGRDMSDTIVYRTAVEGDTVRSGHVIREHTDGYLLQQLLVHEDKINKQDVLIVDEAHERNPNIDLAIAIALEKGVRLVIQSASMDTDKWVKYCSKNMGNTDVPVLDLPGVMHEVETKIGQTVEKEAIAYANMQPDNPLNIAAILPGKREINDAIAKITNKIPKTYKIFPLHAEQSIEDQQRAMETYGGGKVIFATEILRQSVTIPDLDIMIDSMYTRSGDYKQGIRYLRSNPVSRSGMVQGKGRVGRTKEGVYVQANLEGYPPIERNDSNEPKINSHDTPLIMRTDVAPFMLRLGRAGLQLGQLELQDMPQVNEREYAHHKLVRLGAQVLNSVKTTEIGEMMSKLPLDPHYARMFVESQKYSRTIEMQMAAMVSAAQQEGITINENNRERWRLLTREQRSDMLVQLDVFVQALTMKQSDINNYNIIDQRLKKARKLFDRLTQGRGYSHEDVKQPTEDERQILIGCMIAGADKLFISYGSDYTDGASFSGRLAKSSNIRPGNPMVIGSGLVIEHYRDGIKKFHSVITSATVVTPEQLVTYAPWRCTYGEASIKETKNGYKNATRDLYFDGHATGATVKVAPSIETTQAVIEVLMNNDSNLNGQPEKVKEILADINRIRDLLIHRSSRGDEYHTFIEMVKQGVGAMKDIEVVDMRSLADIMYRRGMHNILKNSYSYESADVQEIMRQSPNRVMVSADGELIECEVQYHNNDAYVAVPVHKIRHLSDYGVNEQLGERNIYVWTDSGKKHFRKLDNAIEMSKRGNRLKRRMR